MKPQSTKVAVILHSDDKNIKIDLNVDETYVYSDFPEKVEFGKCLPLNSMGLGDLFRHLDSTGIIKNDFIFVSSNLVYELDFSSLYNAHVDGRKNKPQLVMTLIATPGHSHGNYISKDVDLLHYSPKSDYINLPFGINEFVVQNDIQHISGFICSADVPLLFTENFDYLTLDDFVKGILESELLDKQFNLIHANAFCIQDTNLTSSKTITSHYKLKNSKLLKDYLSPAVTNSPIPKSTKVDWHSTIINSVIGKNCKIINSMLVNCIIGNNCIIKDCTINDGAVVANDIQLNGCDIEENANVEQCMDIVEYLQAKELELYKSMILKSKLGGSSSKLMLRACGLIPI